MQGNGHTGLLNAEEAAELLGLRNREGKPLKSWVLAEARADRVPHIRLGRYVVFDPDELAVLLQTKLTLVAVREAGHNPVKATGLLFAYLEGICKRTRPDEAQIWTPAAAERPHTEPWQQLERVAKHRNEIARDLFGAHRLTDDELTAWTPSESAHAHSDAWSELDLGWMNAG